MMKKHIAMRRERERKVDEFSYTNGIITKKTTMAQ